MKYTRDMLPTLKLSEKTMYDYIVEYALEKKDNPMIMTENYALSANEVLQLTHANIAFLSGKGIKKGEIVALRLPVTVEALFLSFALQSIGAIIAFCDPHIEVQKFIAGTGVNIRPDWYITDEGGAWRLHDSGFNEEGVLNVITANKYPADKVAEIVRQVSAYDPAYILFTSGSTGKSKAVFQTQYSMLNTVYDTWASSDFQANDRSLIILPLYHLFGFSIAFAAVIVKQILVVPSSADIESTFRNIERFKITRLFGVPTYFISMAASGLEKKYDISSLRIGYTAAGPYTEDQYAFIEKTLGCNLAGGYGMSEFVGISLSSLAAPPEVRSKGVGFPYKNIDCVIKSESGSILPLLTEGEICVKGYPMMIGYYNDPEATKEVIDNEGYLHTGDLGYLDEDGILYITGRIKDLIIRGGKNLSPYKIETALLKLPYIRFASVCGISDELYGEVPAAMVVFKTGMSATPQKIKQDLLESDLVIKPELPVRIEIAAQLPTLPTGKVDKVRVKELLGK